MGLLSDTMSLRPNDEAVIAMRVDLLTALCRNAIIGATEGHAAGAELSESYFVTISAVAAIVDGLHEPYRTRVEAELSELIYERVPLARCLGEADGVGN